MANATETMTIASIYENRDRALDAGGDYSLIAGMTTNRMNNLADFAKDLIKSRMLSFDGAEWVSVSTVERVLNDLRYDLMDLRSIIGDFLPGAVSMVSDESRVVISLGWQVVNERPVFVILGRGDDDSYNLLDLETAEVVSVLIGTLTVVGDYSGEEYKVGYGRPKFRLYHVNQDKDD